MTGAALAALLEAQGYDFFTGVPCSMISSLIAALETHPRLPYVPAVREDVAVGLAAGAWLAGRRPLVLMQNSGLGTSLNALVSLSLLYRLPALLLVTWRGHRGTDAPEHLLMGEISPSLLEMIRIPHRVLSAKSLADDVAWGRAESDRLSQPVALLLPPGILEPAAHAAATSSDAVPAPAAADSPIPAPRISRFEALRAAVSALSAEPVVHANGYVCRESFAVKDRIENFYMIGSMGLASAIGLGVALAAPRRPVVVFDGDGNLLMSLGILPMIGGGPVMGRGRPGNLVHVVFDNALYGSTGNQASPSRAVGLHHIARAAGYERAIAVAAADELRAAVAAAVAGGGPSFILARVTGEEQPAPRIPYPPEEIRDRFRSCFGGRATPGPAMR
ncbi:MAG TPA: thiamine pyrophosphate-dependent enzyme [Candidatus Deferrimicrobiaceae bacterium]|nr:thiamine pyrophosphate-dependent enzyme [Candidatus Deferrimicrobiaceae bacterium]